MAEWWNQIEVLLTDERGQVLEALDSPGRDLIRALPHSDDAAYPYLRFIDWVDTTTFTAMQMRGVVPELRRRAGERPSPVLDRLLAMAERCEHTTHSRLVFSGV